LSSPEGLRLSYFMSVSLPNLPMPKEKSYRELVEALCLQAGEVLRASFAKQETETVREEVTRFPEVELRLMYLVTAFVKQHFSGDAVFGQDDDPDFSGRVWVCDPVDGSYFFTHGIPMYSFSISLLEKGIPVVGAIYEPVGDRLYYAEKGKGSTINGKPVKVPAYSSLEKRIVMLSGSANDLVDLGGLYSDLVAQGAKAIITYSTVQHSARILTGEVAAIVNCGNFIQDVTAARLIIEEAGGVVSDLSGEPHRFSTSRVHGSLAAGSHVHPDLVKLVSRRRIGD